MKLDLVWLADRLYAPAAFRDGGDYRWRYCHLTP